MRRIPIRSLTISVVLAGLSLGFLTTCAHQMGQTQAGLENGTSGIRIVATYDPRFDRIFDKYRVVSVTFLNQSPQLIELDPALDQWVLTNAAGQKVKAINSLRLTDPRTWSSISLRAQETMEYPRVILRNTTVTFDLLVPKQEDITGFGQIDFYSRALDRQFIGGTMAGEEG